MEPANFPEIYTGNGDESDRMQDIAGCFDPIIPRNDGFQYDIEAAASDVCHGKDKWKLPILPVAPGKISPGRSAGPPFRLRDGKIILAGAAVFFRPCACAAGL